MRAPASAEEWPHDVRPARDVRLAAALMRPAHRAPTAAPRPLHSPGVNFRCCLPVALTPPEVESVQVSLPRQAAAVEPIAAPVHRQPAATPVVLASRVQQPAVVRWRRRWRRL